MPNPTSPGKHATHVAGTAGTGEGGVSALVPVEGLAIHPCAGCHHLSDHGCIRDGMDYFGEPRDPIYERSHSWWKAWNYGTCGKRGRFFKQVEIA